MKKREALWGWILISPWIIGFLCFTAGPMLTSLYLSFHTYDLHSMEFVGAANYQRLFFVDRIFWKSLQVTMTYAVLSVPLGIAASLALAVLLNQKVGGLKLFRTLFYLPSIVPGVASALLWQWLLNTDNGALNQVVEWVGLPPVDWLQNEKFTIYAFVLMSLWGAGGMRMVIFLAGLQGISDNYHEAAMLDGAGAWRRFRSVTLPLLSPVMFFNVVMGVIGSFQVFTSAYVMTGGGPNNATRFYALYLFTTAFEQFKLGKASAMAWVLFIILLALTGIQFAAGKRWVHYEGASR